MTEISEKEPRLDSGAGYGEAGNNIADASMMSQAARAKKIIACGLGEFPSKRLRKNLDPDHPDMEKYGKELSKVFPGVCGGAADSGEMIKI